MDWLRWHHGTVADPKWRVVARASGRPLAEVVAVWALMLEHASANATERGTLFGWDHEVAAAALDMEPEHVESIVEGMHGRVHDGERLTAWSRRQPKREREDTGAAERARAWRERQKEQAERHRTPANASERIEQNREEQNRSKTKKTPPSEGQKPRPAYMGRAHPLPADWKPNTTHAAIAEKLGVSLDAEVATFRDHAEAKGRLLKNWDAGFRMWLRNAAKLEPNGRSPPRKQGEMSDDEWLAKLQSELH